MQLEGLEKVLMRQLEDGRRNEALPVAEAYVKACLKLEKATQARMDLVRLAERGLRARVALPFAHALERWSEQHAELSIDEKVLLASLYYVGGQYEKGESHFRDAEPDLALDRRRQWVLIARLTSLLRLGRVEQARDVAAELKRRYPASLELDEVKYRFSVHYYKAGDLKRAEQCFTRLKDTTKSMVYKKLCRQYLARIDHHQKIRR
jgi:tetratricopeptide (TPR) repeat protein